ncbi:CHIA-like protein [Mya arenaria]|uniref:CHIA-like protein n=1 Tax=Mya arenaria TaxID=6604 RepID=A0ABY7DAZ8_MYAAR|nr:CHIA-like protein [Mya arenaria]
MVPFSLPLPIRSTFSRYWYCKVCPDLCQRLSEHFPSASDCEMMFARANLKCVQKFTVMGAGFISYEGMVNSEGLRPGASLRTRLVDRITCSLCDTGRTHLILINTVIKDGQIAPASPDDVTRYFSKVPLLRQQNPALKIIICNGGGGNHGFTPILASAANRSKFVSSAAPFLKKYDFDGLDIDFEFPGWQLPVQQRKNFTVLLQELRTALDHAGQAEGRKSLDFINLMCYDYYGYAVYDPVTGYNSPLYPQDWQKKIVIRGGNIVCKFLNTTGTVSVRDVEAGVPYAYRGDQWISYDDVMSQTLKTQWILQNGFGGIMVYALNSDDYYGNACGLGRFPLLSAIKGAMNKTWSETYMYAFKR